MIACAAYETIKLSLSPCAKQHRNPCSGPYLRTRMSVRAMIDLLKKLLSFANQDDEEFETLFR